MVEGVFVPFRTRIRTTIALLAAYVDRGNHMIRLRIPHVCPAPYFVGLCLQLWQIQRSVSYLADSEGIVEKPRQNSLTDSRLMKHNVDEAAAYGITVYDWRHARLEWVNNHPNGMNDDGLLLDREQSGCWHVILASRASNLASGSTETRSKLWTGSARCAKRSTTPLMLTG